MATCGSEMGSDQSAVRSSFGCVLLLNQIYLTTICRLTIVTGHFTAHLVVRVCRKCS